MVDFRRIAVFILGTVAKNGRLEQPYPTYLESRIQPIVQTWGQFFPLLYFVFGRNVHDVEFLTKQCRLVANNVFARSPASSEVSPHRILKVRSPQIELEHSLDLYRCPIHANDMHYFRSIDKHLNLTESKTSLNGNNSDDRGSESGGPSSNSVLEFNVLLARNCTGEYFGYGPTCRCQEAMRYSTVRQYMQGAFNVA